MNRVTTKITDGLCKILFGKTRDELAYERGQAAAQADMPRWRQAIEASPNKGKSWVTIPVRGWFRPFFRHGGEGLFGYYEALKRELGDWWHVQPEWYMGCDMYVRRLRPLNELEPDIASLEKRTEWWNEDALIYGRLCDERAEVKRLIAAGKAPLN